ncbi:SufB/SufD family protein [Phaeovulum vinaykumarii]|uniref:Fe-S cluster assembly protein SufD n=1 Tax=Phaeovulum vinaykumarii TaxID=407234 RepID=A0A1N7JIM6_9RHOB|nr:SufD family Fe-S cluster assembly protein [Phaeovulum vinaykumarii]SIS49160.1 Fe-S cluster assembly protein SufD [Phaeovulum vinaykumarii]SOB89437.1 Fe-S cluster assembly protein SufD [Phaeovulum vinaykumarii]
MAATPKAAEALSARLARLPARPEGGFSRPARAAALERLQEMGLPQRRDEYWRFSDPASLIAPEPPPALLYDTRDETLAFDGMDRVTLVFTDGVFDAEASDRPEAAGVTVARLAEADQADLHWAQGLYGQREAAGQSPVPRPLAALNTAVAGDGLLIHVTDKAEKPIHLVYRHRSETSDVFLHHCVKVDAGAEVTVLESGPAGARFNTVMEVDVAVEGAFHHVRLQGRDHSVRGVTHCFARVGEKAAFKSFTLSANGAFTRNECVLDIVGDEAVVHVAGAALGDGNDGDFLHDDTVFITHGAERCESRQVFKKVLKHGASGVFQGKILVKPGAQKTDGYQISQALLLDDASQFLAKPELEIYADDVKCSHGSTTGAIDETALFYLRSRGVPKDRAISMLVLSFMADAVEEIEDEALRIEVTDRLEGWLARHHG